MEKVKCATEFWMDFRHTMDERRQEAKELLSESWNLNQDLGKPVSGDMSTVWKDENQSWYKDNCGDKILMTVSENRGQTYSECPSEEQEGEYLEMHYYIFAITL